MNKSEIIQAFRENRVGLVEEYVEINGNKVKMVAAVFVRGTIGLYAADAYRIAEDGSVIDGKTAVPVRLTDVSHMYDDVFWELVGNMTFPE